MACRLAEKPRFGADPNTRLRGKQTPDLRNTVFGAALREETAACKLHPVQQACDVHVFLLVPLGEPSRQTASGALGFTGRDGKCREASDGCGGRNSFGLNLSERCC